MAVIAPFRAWRYDPHRVDLSRVLTQPYDKISPEMQERYYASSPYNLVRIILGKPGPTDRPEENVYTRAAEYFREWREQGIFRQDAEPSVYAYVENFRGLDQEALERRGLVALGRIEDYTAKVVFRHEQTLTKPKADRLELLRASRAHFEQLFMLYSDPEEEIDRELAPRTGPDISIGDEDGVQHRLWKISDSRVIDRIRAGMSSKKLIIADGHHRYETALNYRNERRALGVSPAAPGAGHEHLAAGTVPSPGSAAARYEMVMMTFINMDGPGLVILPTHRVVEGLPSFSAETFDDRARQYFSVEEVDTSIGAERAAAILREAGRAGCALLAVTPERVMLLDRPRALGSTLFNGLSFQQQELDVVQLHQCVLEGALGISKEAIREQRNIRYVRDLGEALGRVRGGGAQVAFLMNPVRMSQVRDLAFAGEVLPQKSTDFYPKLLSGLTIYALE
ncbi:MAG TPA: DUF1015 domain-containing protein [Terriglobales bacterium]|nr:DUF1015 domain-containing protein [Terriglobales bacterium]